MSADMSRYYSFFNQPIRLDHHQVSLTNNSNLCVHWIEDFATTQQVLPQMTLPIDDFYKLDHTAPNPPHSLMFI